MQASDWRNVMRSQTVDQLLPFLQLLQQPAFCLRQDGTMVCNREARNLVPYSADALNGWLGESAPLYEKWDRQDPITLPLPMNDRSASVTIHPLADGILFLLNNCHSLTAGSDALAVTAQVLRQPLTDLSTLTQQLSEVLEEMEDPILQSQSAAINRQIYRLSRIACNLADLEQIRNGSYQPRREKLDLLDYLNTLTREMEDVCRSAGRVLLCKLPEKPTTLTADPMLLERAVLNLLSNAIKYGDKAAPIHFHVETTPSSVLFQMKNTCSEADSDLLTAAFQRLSQRGMLPDPQWGIGLGLPLTRYIAHLMGGAVAVEVSREHIASVTMSVSRKSGVTEVQAPHYPPIDYTGGMRHSLVELSDVLPDDCFDSVSL